MPLIKDLVSKVRYGCRKTNSDSASSEILRQVASTELPEREILDLSPEQDKPMWLTVFSMRSSLTWFDEEGERLII